VAPEVLELPIAAAPDAGERDALVRRARLLAFASLGWHAVEAVIAVALGVAAGSIALVGFGGDSLVEAGAAGVVVWRFAGGRSSSEAAELRAQRLVGASFFLLAAYVTAEAARTLLAGDHPDASWAGIALAAVTLVAMPPLAAAKARVGRRLGSQATASEGRQNLLCAYLSVALLVGLGANALAGLWWADPVAALTVAGVALKEGREAWRGEGCCSDPACPG
jgi:divalent metal cation (Fe/Co/Zn/Cd) transporter